MLLLVDLSQLFDTSLPCSENVTINRYKLIDDNITRTQTCKLNVRMNLKVTAKMLYHWLYNPDIRYNK